MSLALANVYNERGPIPGAVEFLYELLLERPGYANISHQGKVTFRQHEAFVFSRRYARWLIVQNDKAWVGAVNSTANNELGVAIKREHQRKGYALRALRMFLETFPPLPPVLSEVPPYYVANVAPQNEASLRLFRKLGGVVIQHTFRL